MNDQSAKSTGSTPGSFRGSFRGLVALNLALLGVLAAVTFIGDSQAGAQARGRGEYTMVAGGVQGSESAAAWIVDVANQEMIAVRFDHNNRVLDGIGYRNLAQDAANAMRPNRPGN